MTPFQLIDQLLYAVIVIGHSGIVLIDLSLKLWGLKLRGLRPNKTLTPVARDGVGLVHLKVIQGQKKRRMDFIDPLNHRSADVDRRRMPDIFVEPSCLPHLVEDR